MEGLSAAYILQYGIVFSVGFALIALGALYLNPRIMLASYPKEVQAQQAPLSPSEKRQQTVLGILVWGYALVGLFYSNFLLAGRSGQAAFLPLFLTTYLVFEIVNLFDLLVIDYLVLLVLKPPALFIPGTLALGQDHGFGFHFKGFLKGSVLGVVISAVIALISLVVLNIVAI
jgi:hypothetical protein